MCNGMTGSLTGEPSTSKVMDSKSASKTDSNKPNAMTLLMSKQRKGQPKASHGEVGSGGEDFGIDHSTSEESTRE